MKNQGKYSMQRRNKKEQGGGGEGSGFPGVSPHHRAALRWFTVRFPLVPQDYWKCSAGFPTPGTSGWRRRKPRSALQRSAGRRSRSASPSRHPGCPLKGVREREGGISAAPERTQAGPRGTRGQTRPQAVWARDPWEPLEDPQRRLLHLPSEVSIDPPMRVEYRNMENLLTRDLFTTFYYPVWKIIILSV